MPCRVWTTERDAILRELYPAAGARAAVEALGMSRSAVKNRVHQLGLHAPDRTWTAEEDAFLRANYGHGMTAAECAAVLGRGYPATSRRCMKLRLLADRNWTDAEKEIVRTSYASRGGRALAIELLGSADDVNLKSIRHLAFKLGVTVPFRHPPEVYARVRELHGKGLNDRQIADELKHHFPGRNDRERVTAIRRRMGLPKIEQDHRVIGAAGRAKQAATGVNPRDAAFSRFATQYGLPADTPPRAVEILIALASGPKTRIEIENVTGHKPHLIWNAIGTSYLAGLARRGLIAMTRLPVNRGPRTVYTLTPAAIELLATKQEPTK